MAEDWENAPQPVPLARKLADFGLTVSVDVITCYWKPAERVEVDTFLDAMAKITGKPDLRKTPPMPDVLCPIYDDLYTRRSHA